VLSSKRITRDQLKPGEVLCSYCTARCCRYFALEIDPPETWAAFDFIRWYLMHGSSAVFVDGETWYLMVYADCKHLLPDNLCGAYDTRPQICRDYTTDNCEYDDGTVYDQFFETAEQLWEYAHAVLPPREPRRFSPAPPQPQEVRLPLLAAVH
jgi:Fe-S-cluster containining protein